MFELGTFVVYLSGKKGHFENDPFIMTVEYSSGANYV